MMPILVYKANKIERIVYDRIYFIFICFSNKLYNFFVEITLKYFSNQLAWMYDIFEKM